MLRVGTYRKRCEGTDDDGQGVQARGGQGSSAVHRILGRVTTVGKIPAHSDGPEGRLVGPTGVQDAFRLAVAEMVTVERRRRSASLREEMLKIPDPESLASSPTWSRRVAVVDHRLVRCAFRSPSGGAWAAVADLGPVVLALSGDAIALDEYELVAQDSPAAR